MHQQPFQAITYVFRNIDGCKQPHTNSIEYKSQIKGEIRNSVRSRTPETTASTNTLHLSTDFPKSPINRHGTVQGRSVFARNLPGDSGPSPACDGHGIGQCGKRTGSAAEDQRALVEPGQSRRVSAVERSSSSSTTGRFSSNGRNRSGYG